jgi:Rod binding domain-containing protein
MGIADSISPASARLALDHHSSVSGTGEAAVRKAMAGAAEADQAEMVAGEFEAILLNLLVGEMRKSVPQGGLLGEGMGGEIYLQMLDQEYARLASRDFRFEFHDALVREITSNRLKPDAEVITNASEKGERGEGESPGRVNDPS